MHDRRATDEALVQSIWEALAGNGCKLTALAEYMEDGAGRALSYGEVPDLSGLSGVHIECKRAETLRLSEWMAQAERDAQRFGDGAPAVFFRRSCSPWCVVMKLEDWMAIYKNRHELPDIADKGGGDND